MKQDQVEFFRFNDLESRSLKDANKVQALPMGFDFSRVNLHIGMPCYGGMVSEATMMSLLNLSHLSTTIGLSITLTTMSKESLVTRARNNIMAQMMSNPNATHFMFIDADIRFVAESVLAMIACNKDVIGGLYPKKGLPIDYVFNPKKNTKIEGDIFTVEAVGTGFLLFKRHVYEKLIEAHPECKYIDDVGLGKQYEPWMYSIFDVAIGEDKRYLSEDWLFCKRWQAIGGEIWAHSKVLLNHIGHFEFVGSLEKIQERKEEGIQRVQDILKTKNLVFESLNVGV
ncbi:MAG: hypothetical protein EBZ47_00100 [Chlamydiae bacterium]|nr:hypothetical protein [Chlamydiota bacterium]